MPNIREALEFSLSEDGQAALAIIAALQPFWMSRGMLREAGQWTDHALASAPREPTRDRVQALFSAALVVGQPSTGNRRSRASRSRAVCITERTWASTSLTSGFLPNSVTTWIGSST